MITARDFADWLRTKIGSNVKIYVSSISTDDEQCLGIYSRRNGEVQPNALGKRSSYEFKPISILVHWSKNATTCEQEAIAIWDLLRSSDDAVTIGGKTCWISARSAPFDVGKTEKGIYEQVVDCLITIRL